MREEALELAGLRVVSVGEPETADQVIVLLHGFAMKPSDLSPFAHSLRLPAWFLFPEGPLEGGGARAWWHIDTAAREAAIARGPRDFAEQHPPDLPAARSHLAALVAELAPRVRGRPFYLGGFSQGAMLTFDTVLRSSFALDGVFLFSGSRIAWDEQEPLLAKRRLEGIPALVAHGRADADLAFSAGEGLRDAVSSAGADMIWLPFDQGHEIPLIVWRTMRKVMSTKGQ